ncbi:calcium-binding protein [Roseibium sp. M-1]
MPVQLWNGPIDVNTTTTGDQASADIAVLADGRFVVWRDDSTGTSHIMQRVFNADGSAATDELVAIEDPSNDLANPVVTALPVGGWAIAAAHVAGGGGAMFTFNTDASNASSFLSYPLGTEANTHLDGFMVGDEYWIMEADSGTDNEIDVFNNILSGNAYVTNSLSTAQTDITGTQTDPAGAQIANGNVVLAWREGANIEFRIVTDTRAAVTLSDTVVTVAGSDAASNTHGKPHVLALENGGFLITWSDDNSAFPGSGSYVWGRIYAPDGSAFSAAPFLVNGNVTSFQFDPVAVPLKSDGFAVFYMSVAGDDFRGQFFDNLGNRLGQEFQVTGHGVLGETGFDAVEADVLEDGRIVVSYSLFGADLTTDVRVQIIDPRDGNIFGDGGDNTLFGSRNNDDMFGGDGADTLNGLEGRDQLFGGTGDDTLDGEDGEDKLYGDSGTVTLSGGDGNDVLSGGAGSDTLDGGEGTDWADYRGSNAGVTVALAGSTAPSGGHAEGDTLTGNSLVNTLRGENGNDILIGGAGADVLDGSTGADWADYRTSNAAVTVVLAGIGAQSGGHAEGDTLTNIENVFGSNFNDAITGNGLDNSLRGGAGNDVLKGGNGADTLRGDAGNDVLLGGAGGDIFFFAAFHGSDTVLDFQNGSDRFFIASGANSFAALAITADGGDTLIDFTGTTIRLNGINTALIDAGDFIFT